MCGLASLETDSFRPTSMMTLPSSNNPITAPCSARLRPAHSGATADWATVGDPGSWSGPNRQASTLSASLDRSGVFQADQVVPGESQLEQHLFGVLAGLGRRREGADGAVELGR